MAYSVRHPTLGFGSGHDLTVHGFEPHVAFHSDGAEPAWDFLSLSPPPLLTLSISLSQNKLKKKKTTKKNNVKSISMLRKKNSAKVLIFVP